MTRRLGERIRIGPDVWVEIIDIDCGGRRVKVGIVAPDNVTILREELIQNREPRDENRRES